jgi:SAM-dependent methyltransferase
MVSRLSISRRIHSWAWKATKIAVISLVETTSSMPEPFSESYYIHGASPEEQARLTLLNEVLNEGCLRELGLRGGERILDVGSGLGQFSRMMAQAAGAGAWVLGIERDERQLTAARGLAAAANEQDLVEFRAGDAMALPLRDEEWGAFDVAHARFVLEHIDRPEAVVTQMAAALKPGGKLVISDDDHATYTPTPDPPGFRPLWEAYLRAYDRAGNDPFIGRRLISLLHRAGLREPRNTLVFFGGCAGQAAFSLVADNLIGILEGARAFMLEQGLIEADLFDQAMKGLRWWKARPDAALWYGLCWAEGRAGLAPHHAAKAG